METKTKMNVLVPVLLLSAVARIAHADIITVQGSTSGAFYDSADVNQGTRIGHLTFTPTTFGPTDSDQTLTLGTFDLSNGTSDYDGFTFNLLVSFIVPAGASGSPVTADISGSVRGNRGSVNIDFPNTPTPFTFANQDASGSFGLTVSDLAVDLDTNKGVASLTGTLSNVIDPPATVPEPASVILFGTCLTGIAMILRRRVGA